jgi:hypothetical protein
MGHALANKHELPIPGPAQQDDSARELVRVWAAAGAQHVALATGLWKDPAAWGIVLADLARHVARAYEETEGMPQPQVLKRIRDGFEAEWGHPTDEPKGEVS